MARVSLRERLTTGLILLDGAMGTQLIARGAEVGTCSDYLNIESPQIVLDVHRAYLQAGSDAILTNTFGANRYALGRHGLAEQVGKINQAGAEIARKSILRSRATAKDEAAGREKYVLGDIGPSGDFIEPLGSVKPDELRDAFAAQAKALLAGGVDGFIIETMTALDEMTIAVEAVKSICGDLPVFASMSFDKAGDDFKTMMGVDVETAVSTMVSLGADVVGFNCGSASLDEYVVLAQKFVSAIEFLNKTRSTIHDPLSTIHDSPSTIHNSRFTIHDSRFTILAEPNAGRPELVADRAVYKVSPEDFAAAAQKLHSAGVNIIGGCCGTTPKHIEAVLGILKK